MFQRLFRVLFLTMIAAFVMSVTLIGQDDLVIEASVKDKSTAKSMEGVLVQIYKKGSLVDSYTTTKNGRFRFELPLGEVYDVKFSKPDFVPKKLEIDTQNIPDEDKDGGFQINPDMTLFAYIDGFDMSIMEEPIGILYFDSSTNSLAWDMDHTSSMQKKISRELDRLEGMAEDLEQMKKDFDELIRKGDQDMREEDFGGAVDKYTSALDIFPDDEPAKQKLADAKLKFAEWEANQENEKKYNELISKGENNMKSKDYAEARINFEGARDLKPSEQLPKDKLRALDKLEGEMAQQAEYDALVASGDGYFESENYAVAIEKYEAALKIFPSEKYPQNQIKDARVKLDALLADEAAKAEFEQKYKDLITLGDRNEASENYDDALKSFKEASAMKPNEPYPSDRIKAIEGMLAALASQADKDRMAAEANAEQERINKEYQALIDSANDKFEAKELESARADYVAASNVKPTEKYPKSRIQRIDDLLAAAALAANDESDKIAAEAAERERLRLAAEQEAADRDRLAAEEQKRRMEEEMAERDRLAAERARQEEEERLRSKKLMNSVDSSTEDEVENYYRNAQKSEESAKDKAIRQKKLDNEEFTAEKGGLAREYRMDNHEEAENQKDQMEGIYREGENLVASQAVIVDRKKEEYEADEMGYRSESHQRRNEHMEEATGKAMSQEALAYNDLERQQKVAQSEQFKADVISMEASYRKSGNASRADASYDIAQKNEVIYTIGKRGEETRLNNVTASLNEKDGVLETEIDLRSASSERRASGQDKAEIKKSQGESIARGKEVYRQDKIYEKEAAKRENENFLNDKARVSQNKTFEARKELFNKDAGSPKDPEDYILPEGAEEIPEGVSEHSYRIGNNKTVIERTVKVGNKVNIYRKVVSKTGTYYFKNGHSCSVTTWKMETMDMRD